MNPMGTADHPHDGHVFIGTVADNADPTRTRRIRIKCAQLWGNTPVNQLPWAAQQSPVGIGGNSLYGVFSVPPVGARVSFELFEGEILSPVYTGILQDINTRMTLFDTNYPNRFGWIQPDGSQFYVDNTAGTFHYTHGPSGSTVDIANDGLTTMELPGGLHVHSVKDIVLEGKNVVVHGSDTLHYDAGGNGTVITPSTRTDYVIGSTGSSTALSPPKIP